MGVAKALTERQQQVHLVVMAHQAVLVVLTVRLVLIQLMVEIQPMAMAGLRGQAGLQELPALLVLLAIQSTVLQTSFT